ncbi:MAG: alpha/beta fold hydrolase [Solirubrobacterales bacterium]
MAISDSLGEVHEVQLEQGTIRYRESGRGRPIVFVHGYLVNGDLWRKVVPKLSGEYRCITADWPMGSHELAMDEDTDLSPPAMADLIADFIDKLGLDDVVLVANDSGGAISQLVVTRRPERIGGLVLTPCDAFDKFPPAPFNLLGVIGRIPVVRDAVYQSMRLPLARMAGFRPLMKHGYDAAIVKSWITPGLKDAGVRRDGMKFAVGMDNKYTLAAAERLPAFDKPVLLAWPPKNTFFKWELAQKLEAALPQARLEPVPDALTFVSEDQPERLAELVAEFAAA